LMDGLCANLGGVIWEIGHFIRAYRVAYIKRSERWACGTVVTCSAVMARETLNVDTDWRACPVRDVIPVASVEHSVLK